MSINLDDASATPEPPRDRFGRYLIPDPDTGKARAWTRATTIAKTIDDPSNLTAWAKRMAATGVAMRPSLAAGIIAAQDDRRRLNDLVEQAIEAAGGTERRELGTALHRLLELVDTGQKDPNDVPDPWAADVHAYRAELAACGLEVVPSMCEVVYLNAPLGIAGTADRVYRDSDGELVVADLKTGGYVSWLSFAMQFAIYATATHVFDVSTGTLSPAPQVRQDHTLMVHLPAGGGTCTIEPLSVAVGMDAVLMALEVRRLRGLDKAQHVRATTWAKPGASRSVVAAAAKVRSVNHQFGPPKLDAARPAATDEGGEITPAQHDECKRRAKALNPQAFALLDGLARDAKAGGHPFSLGAGPTVRRWHIYRALLRLGAHYGAGLQPDHIRATLALVLPDAAQPAVELGPAIGSLTTDEAMRFVQAAVAVIAVAPIAPTIDDNGGPHWADVSIPTA